MNNTKTHLVHVKYSLGRKNEIVKTLNTFLVNDLLNVISSYTAITLEITWRSRDEISLFLRKLDILYCMDGLGALRFSN